MVKERIWITSIDGEEMCTDVEVSWTKEQEEKLRKNKETKFIPYCENSIDSIKCKISWRKKCFENCQDFALNEDKYKEVFGIGER